MIERASGSNGMFELIELMPSYYSNFVDTTAPVDNTNYYRVRACNFFGDSSYSTIISPPIARLTGWPATSIVKATNWISFETADANGIITNVQFFANQGSFVVQGLFAKTTSASAAVNWSPLMEGAFSLSALATDNLGNSQFSAPVTLTAFLDSNGDKIPDVLQVQSGDNPLNPWGPPSFNTNDFTLPSIILMVPINAISVP